MAACYKQLCIYASLATHAKTKTAAIFLWRQNMTISPRELARFALRISPISATTKIEISTSILKQYDIPSGQSEILFDLRDGEEGYIALRDWQQIILSLKIQHQSQMSYLKDIAPPEFMIDMAHLLCGIPGTRCKYLSIEPHRIESPDGTVTLRDTPLWKGAMYLSILSLEEYYTRFGGWTHSNELRKLQNRVEELESGIKNERERTLHSQKLLKKAWDDIDQLKQKPISDY